jgi:hypothetical protein
MVRAEAVSHQLIGFGVGATSELHGHDEAMRVALAALLCLFGDLAVVLARCARNGRRTAPTGDKAAADLTTLQRAEEPKRSFASPFHGPQPEVY